MPDLTTAATEPTETRTTRHTVGRMDALETGGILVKHAEIKRMVTRMKPR